jgi:predicted Zn-dependent protease
MLALSADSYTQVLESSRLSTNQYYVNTVREVGERLTAAVEAYLKLNNLESAIEGYEWQYSVIVSEELNAWCMPGGQIAFYEGILPVCEDEAGIAVVMGHEIAHAVAQHGNERMSQEMAIQMGGMALSEALSQQKQETYELTMAGYNPQVAPAFWERMNANSGSRPPEFLSTHPDPSNRIGHLKELMPKAMEYYNGR